MGRLERGQWVVEDVNPKRKDGEFIRQQQKFRNLISSEPGSRYQPETGRYHLYVSYACPWAHRALIYRKLKGLEDLISVSVVSPLMGKDGWTFLGYGKEVGDQLYQKTLLRDLYVMADPEFSGRVTVPVLWDKKTKSIVNNESSDIIRIFNTAFNEVTQNRLDLYPKDKREKIDEINEWVYHNINNGVYKTGFATEQSAYQKHCHKLFESLERAEKILESQPFLTGSNIVEADWRIFVTLLRFDPVYFFHFKCSIRRIADFPRLSEYMHQLSCHPGVEQTIHIDHIKDHYYKSHPTINPYGIIPFEYKQS